MKMSASGSGAMQASLHLHYTFIASNLLETSAAYEIYNIFTQILILLYRHQIIAVFVVLYSGLE